MFRPRRILLRPKALWTSTNSTASATPVGRFRPVCQRYSSSSWRWGSLTTETRSVRAVAAPAASGCARRSLLVAGEVLLAQRLLGVLVGGPSLVVHEGQPPIGARGFAPQNTCVPSIPMRCTSTMFSTIDFAVAVPTPTGPPPAVVAVVAADEHDGRGHDHALDHAVQEVGWVLEHPEDQEEAAAGHLADLLHHRQVAGEEAGADRGDVHERQHHPRGQQARRAQEEHRVDAHDLEGVDLVGDPHRAELGHDAGADLRGHHVAEGVGHELAQVAPGAEHAGVGGRADRAVEVRALDPALQADDEDEAPDDERRGEDQDPGLAQRLAEEAEDAQAVDLAEDAPAELRDLAEARDPVARDGEPALVGGPLSGSP